MKMNPGPNNWKKLSGRIAYDNPWVQIDEHMVKTPAGTDGIYGIVHFKTNAIAIIPLDEEVNTWIVGQWRYPLGSFEWEVPEGGCPLGTLPEATALRELKEETGLEAGSLQLILEMQLSNSTTNEVSYTYIARDLKMTEAEPEETEDLHIRKLPFQELYEMTMRGEIRDGLSVASILKAKLLLDAGLL